VLGSVKNARMKPDYNQLLKGVRILKGVNTFTVTQKYYTMEFILSAVVLWECRNLTVIDLNHVLTVDNIESVVGVQFDMKEFKNVLKTKKRWK
jgi:hypothetical protein